MTLPVSPPNPMSFSQINTELGLTSTATISLNDSAVRTLAGVGASPATIAITNLSGKANQFNLTISSNQTNVNLGTYASANGWNGSSKLVVTINSGVYISSNSTGTPALTVSGSFPGTVSLTNGGTIVGMGGAGGHGWNITGYPNANGGQSGFGGGTALSVSSPITITNNGTIAGGGGGGGAGEGTCLDSTPSCGTTELYGSGGGGGGQSSTTNSSGGGAGIASGGGYNASGGAGGAGTSSAAGSGGAASPGSFRSGSGGAGGSWGSSGSSGNLRNTPGWANYTSPNAAAQSGGSAGPAVTGNSSITWPATGTRYGPIS